MDLDKEALSDYLKRQNVLKADIDEIKKFSSGQSNPTYLITSSSNEQIVLRKKPPGTIANKTAHNVAREYTILAAIHSQLPVPKVLHLCPEASVLDSSFYAMEYVRGHIHTDNELPEVPVEQKLAVWEALVDTHIALHRIDIATLDLPPNFFPATSSNYFERQLRTLERMCRSQAEAVDVDTKKKVGIPCKFDKALHFFSATYPRKFKTRLIHGDMKMDNLIFDTEKCRVITVLDWELVTIGYPLIDLMGALMPFFLEPNEPCLIGHSNVTNAVHLRAFRTTPYSTAVPFDHLLERYSKGTNVNYTTKDYEWAACWVLFRMFVIYQGIAARYATRQASNDKAREVGGLYTAYGALLDNRIERLSHMEVQPHL